MRIFNDMRQFQGFGSQHVCPPLDAAGDVLSFDVLFKFQNFQGQCMVIASSGPSFCFLQHIQRLPIKAFVVQYPRVIHHLADLDVIGIFGTQKPQTGKELLVQMCFEIGELTLFDFGYFFQNYVFLILSSFFQKIEKLQKQNVF